MIPKRCVNEYFGDVGDLLAAIGEADVLFDGEAMPLQSVMPGCSFSFTLTFLTYGCRVENGTQ